MDELKTNNQLLVEARLESQTNDLEGISFSRVVELSEFHLSRLDDAWWGDHPAFIEHDGFETPIFSILVDMFIDTTPENTSKIIDMILGGSKERDWGKYLAPPREDDYDGHELFTACIAPDDTINTNLLIRKFILPAFKTAKRIIKENE